ncbi:MAG TPA: YdeI/OmpD-associated family protein, partial [Flavisolibacter sp.]|nr:YdeI/OmpD-associated family protein [Flavisolibacter sp.]
LHNDVTCWIYFPKGRSGVQTDLTRDSLWQQFSGNPNLQWLSLVSFNDTWSAFALRPQTAGTSKTKKATERPVQAFIDPVKRTVYLPDDFSEALSKASQEKAFFDSLSFTNKKEYVEWIVSAKREETRKTRVQESVSRLAKGWKNPSNR